MVETGLEGGFCAAGNIPHPDGCWFHERNHDVAHLRSVHFSDCIFPIH